MDNNFLVDNPNKPKAKKPPRKRLISDKRMKEISFTLSFIDLFAPAIVSTVAAAIYAPGSTTTFLEALAGAVVFSMLAGAVLEKVHDGKVGGDFLVCGVANLIVGFVCTIFLFPAHAPDIAANLTSNVTSLANATAKVTPDLSNTTALLNGTSSCAWNCSEPSTVGSNITSVCTISCPIPQIAQNITASAHEMLAHASATGTAAVGAIAGPVREVRSLVSRKLESLNRSLKL